MDVTYFFTAKYPLCKCGGSCINFRENRIRARHHSHTDNLEGPLSNDRFVVIIVVVNTWFAKEFWK